jgi:hypothetical protein
MLPRERRLTPAECHRSNAVPWHPQMYPGIVQMHPSVLMKPGVLVCPNILMHLGVPNNSVPNGKLHLAVAVDFKSGYAKSMLSATQQQIDSLRKLAIKTRTPQRAAVVIGGHPCTVTASSVNYWFFQKN